MNTTFTIIGKVSPAYTNEPVYTNEPACANEADSANPDAERKTPAEVIPAEVIPAEVIIDAPYAEGLMSLEPGQEITLLCWLHQARRDILQVHPRGDKSRPMRGVFNTRGSARPNPVGLHEVVIQKIFRTADGNVTMIVSPVEKNVLDVYDDTPLIDIKTNSSQRAAFAAARGRFLAGRERPIDERERRAAADLILHCHKAWRRGLMSGFNGNMSARVGDNCLITASGAVKGQLGQEDVAVVDIAGGRLVSGNKPSSELAMHLELYKAQPEALAIVHTHPPKLLALSELVPPDRLLELPIYEAAPLRRKLGIAEASPPGGRELAVSVAEAGRRHEAVLMRKHGLCCRGKNLKEALALSEELEHLAGIQITLLRGAHYSTSK